MKIRNISKFRDELFAAIKDSLYWDAHESYLVAKSPEIGDAYHHLMTDDEDWHFMPYYDFDKNGNGLQVVALPHALEFRGTSIYLVIDDSADARFYKDATTHFELIGVVTSDYYKNKMSFAMTLVRNIDQTIKENRQ